MASQTGNPRKGGHARENLRKSTKSLDSEEGEVRSGPLPLMKEIPLENSDPPDHPSSHGHPYVRARGPHLLSARITQVQTRTTDHQNGTNNDSR